MPASIHNPSQSLSSKPPRRTLPRSPSDPVHLAQQQPIYVLTADGSSLILLDSSTPQGGEQPPPYASFTTVSKSIRDDNDYRSESGHSPPTHHGTLSAGEGITNSESQTQTRVRASTLSAITDNRGGNRPRLSSSLSHRDRSRRGRDNESLYQNQRRTRSALATPESHSVPLGMPDERTPLLPHTPSSASRVGGRGRGLWRSIFCGDLDDDEDLGNGSSSWKRYWRPVGRGEYWRATLHLVLLNFPFALFVWPPLLVGTLAGTALLIALPIGAAVWWLTLFIARSAARLETIMQLRYHSPKFSKLLIYHPIFYRIRERSLPASPVAASGSTLGVSTSSTTASIVESRTETEIVTNLWEKRFIKCSYAMFLDHYSYSALSYFLLVKPLVTLFSTIAIVVLLPVAFVSIFGLPIYLRAIRRWGRWQAQVALDNL